MARYVPAPAPEPVPAAEEAALRQGRARPWWPYLLTAAVSVALLVWTVDNPRELRRWLVDDRAWLVTTNHPARAVALRSELSAEVAGR